MKIFHSKHIVFALLSWLLLFEGEAQTSASYTISSEMAMGSGEFSAYQLVSNQYDVLSHRANTGYLRAVVSMEHAFCEDLQLSGGADIIASAHAKNSFYLQQCFANLTWKGFFVEVGSKEHEPILRDRSLSSGSLINSGNTRPIPELRIGSARFMDIPGTRQWVQFYFDASYGFYLDGNWQKRQFEDYFSRNHNSFVTTDLWHHQKKLYLRTDPDRLLSFTIGMEHAVQFGGHNIDYTMGKREELDFSPSLGDFFKVIIPSGDGNVGNTLDKKIEWVKGNHLGEWSLMLNWNINTQQNLSAYLESPFEDGSGIRKGNGWDGLWGVEYRNHSENLRWLRGVVFEYLQTTDQCGPVHWSPGDFSGMIEGKLPDNATGNDNYYNNYMYNGYCLYGMSMGTPLLMSPIYNADSFCGFVDNRVKAWHLGIKGELTNHWGYLVRGSYREGLGTYFVPLKQQHHSLDMLFQADWQCGNWHLSAAYANDLGNIYGDCHTFNFKVAYHGRIL